MYLGNLVYKRNFKEFSLTIVLSKLIQKVSISSISAKNYAKLFSKQNILLSRYINSYMHQNQAHKVSFKALGP